MSTFKERVESYVGDTSFDSSLTEWLTDSARALVNLVPQNRVNQYSLSRGADGGVDVTDCRVLGATRSSVFAREIHHGESTKAADVNSLYIARADDPVFYTKDGTLYVLPTGGSPETQVIPFPTVLFSDDEIDNFPDDFEHLVVLRAAIQASIKLVTDYQELVFSDVQPRIVQMLAYVETQEDIELASSEAQHISTMLANFEKKIMLMRAKINDLNAEYNRCLQMYFGVSQKPDKGQE